MARYLYQSYEAAVNQRTDVLLKTAIAPVSARDKSVMTTSILDDGSQKSFITEDLARKLKLKACGISTISLDAFGDTNRNVRNLEKTVVNLHT